MPRQYWSGLGCCWQKLVSATQSNKLMPTKNRFALLCRQFLHKYINFVLNHDILKPKFSIFVTHVCNSFVTVAQFLSKLIKKFDTILLELLLLLCMHAGNCNFRWRFIFCVSCVRYCFFLSFKFCVVSHSTYPLNPLFWEFTFHATKTQNLMSHNAVSGMPKCSKIQGGPKKTDTQFYFWDNFGNSAPILTILSLLHAEIYGA